MSPPRPINAEPSPNNSVSRDEDLEDTEDDDDAFTASIKRQIGGCLDRVQGGGSFATFAELPNAPNPGIFISGLGNVGLPLSDRDASEIIKASHLAPYGKGTETVVDTEVRKTWELNVDQFKLLNPAWENIFPNILEQIIKDLGLLCDSSGIKAEPYKMLLYEEGAMFKPHKDSEKVPGMFGTLVICLPSQHEGGQVELKHGDETKTFDTAPTSMFDFSWLAWYADVTHEVKPVTAGYRFVLTYNLIHVGPGSRQLAAFQGDERREAVFLINKAITLWKSARERALEAAEADEDYTPNEDNEEDETPSGPDMLAYFLDHKYTDANLSFNHLKGKDKVKSKYVEEACTPQGFVVFLANLERAVTGQCDMDEDGWDADEDNAEIHSIIEVDEEKLSVTRVVDFSGSVVVERAPLAAADIIQDVTTWGGPDSEDWSGPTGNEGVTTTHFYRKTVILIMPQSQVIRYQYSALKDKTGRIAEWIRSLMEKLPRPFPDPVESAERRDLIYICHCYVLYSSYLKDKENSRRSWNDEVVPYKPGLEEVVKASIELGMTNILDDALSITSFESPSIYAKLGEAIVEYGWPEMRPRLDKAMKRLTSIRAYQMAIDTITTAYEDKGGKDTAVVEWARQKALDSVTAIHSVTTEDGDALAKLSQKYGDDFTITNVLPFVKRFVSSNFFTLRFLSGIFQGREGHEETVAKVFRAVLAAFIPKIVLSETVMRPIKRQRMLDQSRVEAKTMSAAGDLAELLQQCETLGLDAEVEHILSTVSGHAAAAVDLVGTFRSVLVPFLIIFNRKLHAQYSNSNSSSSSSSSGGDGGGGGGGGGGARIPAKFCRFVHAAVQTYVARYLSARPNAWAYAASECACDVCARVRDFLLDPARRSITLPDAAGAFDHVRAKLPRVDVKLGFADGRPRHLTLTKPRKATVRDVRRWDERQAEILMDVAAIENEGKLRDETGQAYDLRALVPKIPR